MENLIILLSCGAYGMGLAFLGAIPLVLITMKLTNMYCEKKFGERLFVFKKDGA